ncbi:methionine/alanine import family NSS transporter small subunit [Bacillus infantis]
MSASAITMMIVGMLIIWGGLGASIALAVSKARKS